jgi:hypothetical protein
MGKNTFAEGGRVLPLNLLDRSGVESFLFPGLETNAAPLVSA